jgi:hypothetical protein
MRKADEMVKASKQYVIDEYLESRRQDANTSVQQGLGQGTPPSLVTAPKTFKEAREAAEARWAAEYGPLGRG